MNSRIGLIGQNSIECIDLILKIWNNGDSVALIDWRTPFDTVLRLLDEAHITRCYIEKSIYQNYSVVKQYNVEFLAYNASSHLTQLLPEDISNQFLPNYTNNEAVIIYSSGTTGGAKGVVLSHYAINTNADSIIEYMQPTSTDCMYLVKTISHSSTLTGELLVALKSKARLLIAPTILSPQIVFRNIQNYGVSILCINPALLRIYNQELKRRDYGFFNLKKIYISGDILNFKNILTAKKAFLNVQLYNAYGLSEAGPRVTVQSKDCKSLSSVGKPLKNIEIQVRDSDGNLQKKCKEGVVWVKPPSLFSGYVAGQRSYANVVNGWLNTGDIGWLDDNNELHLVGRADDVIIIDAHKIYPSEVETAIISTFDIQECVVVDIVYNDRPYLSCLYAADQDCKNMRARLSKVLLPYEIPFFFVRGIIPKNKTGKTSRNEAKRYLNLLFGEKVKYAKKSDFVF